MTDTPRQLTVQYFAIFREQAGTRSEVVTTSAATAQDLYAELKARYHFSLPTTQLKVAINNEFGQWQQALKAGDTVTFIPPVAGG